ncbi:hypothetical protein NDU88_003687 [Pleurodeles waltl]|uniref:Uncharacterized protein n=1 Tax=Pleurodeles waltl TaxID=8319 RepID=A0AAV7KY43_PLEWA|nr:hypothetical protein NDU88_003687 [Pleurodeles waltl]
MIIRSLSSPGGYRQSKKVKKHPKATGNQKDHRGPLLTGKDFFSGSQAHRKRETDIKGTCGQPMTLLSCVTSTIAPSFPRGVCQIPRENGLCWQL